MTEKLLQYLWNFKIFRNTNFEDTEGNRIEVLNYGFWNKNSGPDFLDAKIKLGDITFCGPIELHVKASEWNLHKHSRDEYFDNIILHVVYEEDVRLDELYARNIPTLVLKNHISEDVIKHYQNVENSQSFIPCEDLLKPNHIPFQFSEELVIQKLDEKANLIQSDLENHKNDLEEVFFHHISYAFGLKVNAFQFKNWAENIPFKVIQKTRNSAVQLEALFLGKAGLLTESSDEQSRIWKTEYDYLKTKFQLNPDEFKPQFSRLRPDNFPTMRLSQLAQVYDQIPNLFSKLINSSNYSELVNPFKTICASTYWDSHFNLGKTSEIAYPKTLSSAFIDRLLLNTILPFQYFYFRNQDAEKIEQLLEIYRQIKPEENNLIKAWKKLQIPVTSALDSQALLYQHKAFCSHKKCLSCSIGFQLMQS